VPSGCRLATTAPYVVMDYYYLVTSMQAAGSLLLGVFARGGDRPVRRPPVPVCRCYMCARLTWAGRPRAAGAPSCRPARPALFVCFCRTARAHRQQQQQVTGDWDATIRPACHLMHAWYRTTQVLRMTAYDCMSMYQVPTAPIAGPSSRIRN
jgi:hypothetical protein